MRSHGTRAMYVAERCRCAPCREANRRYYHERKTWAHEFPTAATPMVDARPVRTHLRRLHRDVSIRRMAIAAGIKRETVSRIVRGSHTRIRRSTAERLLALDAHIGKADGDLVDSTQTIANLQWLVARGWPKALISREIGSGEKALQVARPGARVTVATERAVQRLVDEVAAELVMVDRRWRQPARAKRVDLPPSFWDRVRVQGQIERLARI